MKTLEQHELSAVSGGEWVWYPSTPAPGGLGSPMDGEWRWVEPISSGSGGSAGSGGTHLNGFLEIAP